jgi:hypothetical protein
LQFFSLIANIAISEWIIRCALKALFGNQTRYLHATISLSDFSDRKFFLRR